ncbi:MAG TPA: hypothetical protein VIE66_10140 [Methylocella sp.]|jgi:hypothetical protein
MTFKPDLKQLEKLIEIQTAGMGIEFAAKYLGCSPEELSAWRSRCAAAARAEYERNLAGPPPEPRAFKA